MEQQFLGIVGLLILLHIMCYVMERMTSGLFPAYRWLVEFERWAWRAGWTALGDLLRTTCHWIGDLAGKGGKKKKKK